MKEVLQTHYRGAELYLELTCQASTSASQLDGGNADLAVTLMINGVTRDRATSQSDAGTLRLTSTVQTDYEWHEFIEAIIDVTADAVNVRLLASNTEVASLTAPRTLI